MRQKKFVASHSLLFAPTLTEGLIDGDGVDTGAIKLLEFLSELIVGPAYFSTLREVAASWVSSKTEDPLAPRCKSSHKKTPITSNRLMEHVFSRSDLPLQSTSRDQY